MACSAHKPHVATRKVKIIRRSSKGSKYFNYKSLFERKIINEKKNRIVTMFSSCPPFGKTAVRQVASNCDSTNIEVLIENKPAPCLLIAVSSSPASQLEFVHVCDMYHAPGTCTWCSMLYFGCTAAILNFELDKMCALKRKIALSNGSFRQFEI